MINNYLIALLLTISTTITFGQTVDLELFSDGFTTPLDLKHAGDDRLFVAELRGKIKILHPDGSVNPVPFLNILDLISTGAEQGLLGIVFHPNYVSNGFFYVNYIDLSGDTQISRFSVDPGDPDLADPMSEFPILSIQQPFATHNGGSLAFGPDGFLYIATGDGGDGGDPGNRAQDLSTLLGKMLRIDVDNASGGNNYAIPAGNPYILDPLALNEIWAIGLRSPWKFYIDPVDNNIWIGDVGQSDVEEVSRSGLSEAGINYGWRCFEGSQPFNTTDCPDPSEMRFPIVEYSSSTGSGNCSVTGGIVYRGSAFSEFAGKYFYADLCSGIISTLYTDNTFIEHGPFSGNIVSFGEDVNRELYVLNLVGEIYKIVDGGPLDISEFSVSQVNIVPNPASEEVNFVLENQKLDAIVIVDMKGVLIFSEENLMSYEKSVNVSSFSNGLYLVKVTNSDGYTVIKKFVIE